LHTFRIQVTLDSETCRDGVITVARRPASRSWLFRGRSEITLVALQTFSHLLIGIKAVARSSPPGDLKTTDFIEESSSYHEVSHFIA
jgi:hypothetical protein